LASSKSRGRKGVVLFTYLLGVGKLCLLPSCLAGLSGVTPFIGFLWRGSFDLRFGINGTLIYSYSYWWASSSFSYMTFFLVREVKLPKNAHPPDKHIVRCDPKVKVVGPFVRSGHCIVPQTFKPSSLPYPNE